MQEVQIIHLDSQWQFKLLPLDVKERYVDLINQLIRRGFVLLEHFDKSYDFQLRLEKGDIAFRLVFSADADRIRLINKQLQFEESDGTVCEYLFGSEKDGIPYYYLVFKELDALISFLSDDSGVPEKSMLKMCLERLGRHQKEEIEFERETGRPFLSDSQLKDPKFRAFIDPRIKDYRNRFEELRVIYEQGDLRERVLPGMEEIQSRLPNGGFQIV